MPHNTKLSKTPDILSPHFLAPGLFHLEQAGLVGSTGQGAKPLFFLWRDSQLILVQGISRDPVDCAQDLATVGGERGKSHPGPGHLLSYLFLILKKPFQNFALGKSAMKGMLPVEGAGSCGASPPYPGMCSTSSFVHRGALAIHQQQPHNLELCSCWGRT